MDTTQHQSEKQEQQPQEAWERPAAAPSSIAPSQPSRTVHACDAISWLQQQQALAGCSFVTSMPDVSEMCPMSLAEWKEWFVAAAALVLSRCPEEGVAIFFQTDIKVDGVWVDKAYMVQKAAEQAGHSLLWHKLVCRVPPGVATFGKPAYHHLLCFAKVLRCHPSHSTPDVLPSPGDKTWTRGMGTAACAAACQFILQHTATRTVVDPFCGHGTVLAVANALGLAAVGVELSGKRARQARQLKVDGGMMQQQDLGQTVEGGSGNAAAAAAASQARQLKVEGGMVLSKGGGSWGRRGGRGRAKGSNGSSSSSSSSREVAQQQQQHVVQVQQQQQQQQQQQEEEEDRGHQQ